MSPSLADASVADFWVEELAGATAELELPSDRARPSTRSSATAREPIALPPALIERLAAMGRGEDATPIDILGAGFAILLHRYSGQNDLLVASASAPSARGDGSREQRLVVLRSSIADHLPYRTALLRWRERSRRALARPGLSPELLARALGREASESPPCRVSLVVTSAAHPGDAPTTPDGDPASGEPSATRGADLSLRLVETPEGPQAAIAYATDLFEPATIRRMCDHYVTLLEAAIRDPEQSVHSLPMLTEPERARLLHEWNDTRADFPQVSVPELFEREVARHPDATALVFEGRTLSYREVDERANQIAHHLRKRGIGADDLVGVCLERSPETVFCLLGVLKAGGAYVPLDPSYPEDRLTYMVRDSAAKLLLTSEVHRELFGLEDDRVICVDSDWPAIERESTSSPGAAIDPASLAYVMYTSGSTGEPKGVMVHHRGVVNYLSWAAGAYTPARGGPVPLHTSIAFDLTVTALFVPLCAGGAVEILTEDVGGVNLVASLRAASDRSLVKITPAHLALLSDQIGRDVAAGRTRLFVIGGENLPAESVAHWRDFAPDTRLVNEYGPTETVVGCCVYEVKPEDPDTGSIPIGRPIANTQLYVLDRHLNPLPVGAIGELYIGGAGVARGYLRRPELTKERFIEDPFSGAPGGRLYKTGDLARYRADGNLEYGGRIDHQVKVRGYRIELGEIEAALADHPAVKLCAVLAREDSPGNKQLIGYFAAHEGQAPTSEELRAFVGKRLADYMVPSRMVRLGSMPLTTNGKIDRRALPAPDATTASETRRSEAPRTEVERALAGIWCELLQRASIGIHDDFFDLGGHSLLAITALARVRDVLGVGLAPETLFEHPTVAAIAALVEQAQGGAAAQPVAVIPPLPGPGPYRVSSAQHQLWLVEQLTPGSAAYNIVDVVPLAGAYDAHALLRALEELVARHDVLRASFSAGPDGEPMQAVAAPFVPALVEHDLRALPEPERRREWARLVREQAGSPFDLAEAPLFRVRVVHASDVDHRLLVTIHHIIADEWSMELVHKEVRELYAAFVEGRPSRLAPLPIQYAAFAAWQRDSQDDAALDRLASFWKSELDGALPVLVLPTDRPRPATASLRGGSERLVLPQALLERLRALGREEHATLFMVLEAAFATLLHRYTGQDDILVGTPISSRTHTETQQLIGCFLNTVVLRAQFPEALTFRALLQQTRERALGAYAHAELPFERLVAELSPARDPGRSPLFQVMFILLNPGGESLVSKIAEHQEIGIESSKFDLTLYLSEDEEGLSGLLEYSTDLFEAETIRRLARSFANLVEAIAQRPDQTVAALPMLADADRTALLIDYNRTDVAFEDGARCLHELFERQAERSPDRVAATFGRERMTYAELDRRSSQLASHLRSLGVGPDALVGLLVERSLEMLVGLLGILKAGGAYVPLDPSFPIERLAYMLEHSRMRVLVTHRQLETKLALRETAVVRLDRDGDVIAKASAERLRDGAPTGTSLAYVLYTSGSTGTPKGVAVSHGAIVNLLLSMQKEPGFTESDVLLAVTTLSFDIAALELFLPLTVGAKVVIASHDEALDPSRLAGYMSEGGCNVLQATPATWRALIDADWQGSPRLKALCGGEALAPDLARALLPRCAELWNMYGPTETTVWSTVHRMSDADVRPPIGRPIANTQVFVLDAQLAPVAPGAVGELYIGGRGLARGYLHAPELTDDRFVPSPFADHARLYRAGDLARWRTDGRLECLGRTDHQIKVRGYRIELGEIEARLTSHPAVREACVVARELAPGDVRLVAYFAVASQERVTGVELQAHLHGALPDYMVPRTFVELAELPRTPNQKIDRKALPAPSEQPSPGAQPSAAPRTEIERTLAGIWSEVLRRAPIGIHDDFFDLGGHSLHAITVTTRIRSALGVELSPRTLLDAPTIAELAARLGDGAARVEEPTSPLARDVERRPEPLYFGEPARFGVYHPASSAEARDAALLICPSIGHEHTRAHRAVRALAEAAALAGLPALRFDYTGVGDSAGELASVDVETWCADIVRAADELRSRSRARDVHVVGLRMGAALAAFALKKREPELRFVKSLFLWDPLLCGRDFLDTARALQRRLVHDPGRFDEETMRELAERRPGDDDLLVGYDFGAATRRSLEALDLSRVEEWPTVPVRAVLSQSLPGWPEMASRLESAGRRVVSHQVDGAPTSWDDYEQHEKPVHAGAVISRIVELLAQRSP